MGTFIHFNVQSKLSPELLLTVLTEETLAVQDKFIGHHFFHWVDRSQAGRAHFTGRQLELWWYNRFSFRKLELCVKHLIVVM